MEARDVIIRPLITEKSYRLAEQNKYCFEVDKRAKKPQIGMAVAEIFEVTVEAVNTVSMRGKSKRRGKVISKPRDWKKAIVTLREGDRIEVFEGGQA